MKGDRYERLIYFRPRWRTGRLPCRNDRRQGAVMDIGNDNTNNEMSTELALWAWKFLLDYHGYEAELEIVNEEEGGKEND